MLTAIRRYSVKPVIPKPHLVLLKVGRILECRRHEDADLLYVSQIDTGAAKGDSGADSASVPTILQVCSGLVKYVPIEQMQGRSVVVVTNLKAAKMRGVRSEAMVLAAELPTSDSTQENPVFSVELVSPPKDSAVGDVLQFVPFTEEKPSKTLKKLAWLQIQPRLKTTSTGHVVYVDEDGVERELRVRDDGDSAYVETLFNATVR